MADVPSPELLERFIIANKEGILTSFAQALDMHPDVVQIRAHPQLTKLCEQFFFGGVAAMFMQAESVAVDKPTPMPLPPGVRDAHIDDGPW